MLGRKLENIIKEFVYLDSIFIVSPVSSLNCFQHLRKSVNDTDLDKRILRTSIFLKYLCECEKTEHQEHPEYFHNELTNFLFCDSIKENFSQFKDYIEKKVPQTATEQLH